MLLVALSCTRWGRYLHFLRALAYTSVLTCMMHIDKDNFKAYRFPMLTASSIHDFKLPSSSVLCVFSLKDYSGSAIVHGLGGICGICASAVLGKRKLQADIVDIGSIPPSAPALVTLGKKTIYTQYVIAS